jgi:hypothetical protein
VIENSASAFAQHRAVGATRRGTPVRLHPRYLDAACRVVLGEVSYHYFAGFGGAPKLVFPGLAEPEGAAHNHRLALLPGHRWNPACGPGMVAGNPVHEDLLEAASLAPPSWTILADPDPNAKSDPERPQEPALRVLQGADVREDAYRSLELRSRIACPRAPDLLLADAGGTPRDDSLLQAHKSIQHAARFLPDGGRLLLAARCADGYASQGLATLAERGWQALAAGELGPLHQQTAVERRGVGCGLARSLPGDGFPASSDSCPRSERCGAPRLGERSAPGVPKARCAGMQRGRTEDPPRLALESFVRRRAVVPGEIDSLCRSSIRSGSGREQLRTAPVGSAL